MRRQSGFFLQIRNKMKKIAVLTSHPIQYQAPLFQKLAKEPDIDLTVYFCWDFGVKKESYDAEFGKKLSWDILLLNGYRHEFLKNYSLNPSSEFWGQINFGVIKKLRENKYDAIIVFGWNSFTNWLVFLTSFWHKTPIFLRGENPLNQEFLKSRWKIKIKKTVLGWLFRRVSAFLYIGEENKKFYQFYGASEKKLFFCPYAVDNERFIKSAQDLRLKIKDLRVDLGINEKDVVVLFVGKLIEKKRPMDLLGAYEMLVKGKMSKVKRSLLFVGDGALRPELEKYAEENNLENVNFVGFKNQTELPRYYAMADIFVLPSGAGETWGLAVNEAMCFSLPIIVSDIVGCGPDLIKQGENGFIFPVGDIERLSFYLKDLAEDDSKRKSFGEKSFEIIQNYSFKKDIEGILETLNSLKQ